MPKIWECEFDSVDDVLNKIEIHSTEVTDIYLGEFCLLDNDATLTWNGQKDPFHPLLSTSFKFTIAIDYSSLMGAMLDWIRDDVIPGDPRQYYIKYFRSGGLKYVGVLLSENITLLDDHATHGLTLESVDAISLLVRHKYNQNAAVVSTTLPLMDHIYLALRSTGIDDYYTTETFMSSVVEYFEAEHDPTDDVLTATYVNGRAFVEDGADAILETGDRDEDFWRYIITGLGSDEVVRRIVSTFAARIYQVEGYYKIAQIEESVPDATTAFYYDKSYTFLNPTPVSADAYQHDITLSDDPDAQGDHSRKGGSWTYLPRVRHVLIKQMVGSAVNLARGLIFYNLTELDESTSVSEDLQEDIDTVDNSGAATLVITSDVESYAVSQGAYVMPVHNMLLHLTVIVDDYYLIRKRLLIDDNLEWTYTDMEWSQTAGVCEILLDRQVNAGTFQGTIWGKTMTELNIETPPVPVSGDLDVRLQYIKGLKTVINDRVTIVNGVHTQVDITNATLPDSSLGKEIIEKLVKVTVHNNAFEYQDPVTSNQTHFSIDNGNNRIILAKIYAHPNYEIKIEVKEHGQDIVSGYDTPATVARGYTTQGFSVSVNSETPRENTSDENYIAHYAANEPTYREVIEEQMYLGDNKDSDSVHKLMTLDGATYTDTELWQKYSTGAALPVLELNAIAKATMRGDLVAVWNTTISHNGDVDMIRPDTKVAYDGKKYIALSGSFHPFYNSWRGALVEVSEYAGSQSNKNSGTVKVLGGGVNKEGVSNLLPTEVTADLIITHTDEELAIGIATSIDVLALGSDLSEGSDLTIIHPTTGQSVVVTLTADADAGDTTITVNTNIPFVVPIGAIVSYDTSVDAVPEVEVFITGVTGTDLDLTDYILPDETGMTDAEMQVKVRLERNGTGQKYEATGTDWRTYKSEKANDKIVLVEAATSDEYFIVKIRQ